MSFLGDTFDFFTGGEAVDQESRQRQNRDSSSRGEETRRENSGQSEESQSTRQFDQSVRTERELTQFRDFLQTLTESGRRDLTSTTEGTQSQVGRSSTLDPETQRILQSVLPGLAGGIGSTAELGAATTERALQTPEEIEEIVRLSQAGATREFEARTLPQISALRANVGASGETNTLVNAVESRAAADLAGTLAGIEGDIRLRGITAANETAGTAAGINASAGDTLAQLAGVLKGAEVTTAQEAEATTTTEETELTNLLRELVGSEENRILETTDTDISGQEVTNTARNSALRSVIDLISQSDVDEDLNIFGSSDSSTSGSFPKLLSGVGSLFSGLTAGGRL